MQAAVSQARSASTPDEAVCQRHQSLACISRGMIPVMVPAMAGRSLHVKPVPETPQASPEAAVPFYVCDAPCHPPPSPSAMLKPNRGHWAHPRKLVSYTPAAVLVHRIRVAHFPWFMTRRDPLRAPPARSWPSSAWIAETHRIHGGKAVSLPVRARRGALAIACWRRSAPISRPSTRHSRNAWHKPTAVLPRPVLSARTRQPVLFWRSLRRRAGTRVRNAGTYTATTLTGQRFCVSWYLVHQARTV